jgi:hypothetical protein
VRRSRLEAIGGFDPRFRTAGDDVDLCWRLQERGWTVGFSPAALVWHHRRNSAPAYWRQQVGYGRAEALLEAKWPEKFNAAGHLSLSGRMYGRGQLAVLGDRRGRIYQGTWGRASFQSLYRSPASGPVSLASMPEWFLVVAMLALLSLFGLSWPPLLGAAPVLALAVALPLIHAGIGAARASFTSQPNTRISRFRLRIFTAMLYLIQPVARLRGRMRYGLSPWRRRGPSDVAAPRPWTARVWSTDWSSPDDRLRALSSALQADQAVVRSGGDYDQWDLEVRGGMLAVVRGLMAVKDHEEGHQLVRFRAWPRWAIGGIVLFGANTLLSLFALLDEAWIAALVLGPGALAIAWRMMWEAGAATAAVRRAFAQSRGEGVT